MSIFLRLLSHADKGLALQQACLRSRRSVCDDDIIHLDPTEFSKIPGSPFSYWVSTDIRESFERFPPFESDGRTAKVGLATANDFRFLKCWWEVSLSDEDYKDRWPSFAKGGVFSQFYGDLPLVLKWNDAGSELKESVILQHGNAGKRVYNEEYYFLPAITWPLRTSRFSPQLLPSGSIFSVRGYTAHTPGQEMATLSLFASRAFDYVFKTALGRYGHPEFIVGVLQKLPWPQFDEATAERLASLARRGWSIKRMDKLADETSRVFILPAALKDRLSAADSWIASSHLQDVLSEIDEIAFDLYKFDEADRALARVSGGSITEVVSDEAKCLDSEESEDDDRDEVIDQTDSLLSWALGTAFGRFDWRLATGEREAPPEPDPFDPLPAKSPGMLPDGAAPFHDHSGILVDDQGHPHDLPRLIEEVLTRVQTDVPADVRRRLQRDFFPLHLKQYSKSRRKAPIYWPLSTTSGSYTLWLYSPSLTSQTLYTAVNDFVEPKLKQVSRDVAILREKGAARTRDDEKAFEALQALELELIELRDTLLDIAPTYRPNHDDGVQITAAPLWPLFRHKLWQKVLKDTWAKLEKGDYDWAHLAMAYWPDRVREKCKTDKSFAIAHDLEDLYEPVPSTEGGKKKKKGSGA
ncbi:MULTISPECIES: type II restriction endonuclease subunit M [unclassified Rhizobium]|uniref:type II restriction endonuclease subunit M n=1 Tax=unclassified Rhizobium TaxID=2613769 RepID=UPI001786273D|nr:MULTISPECIES: type II restriction endonuclease subunit M [unclassified Rhizobium]MBD8689358.1 type II restriction endonuclease subunit M [Rhizobium sp. CFBP 13644]MBD8693883.1 type II restriction endonuclease subunit M [Rhizobium sp. CFBP 13717]